MKDAVEIPDDAIHHPSHYTRGSIEVLDFIEDQLLGYHAGNVVKYLCRYRYKDGLQDLKKAQEYLRRLIKMEEAQ